MTRNYRAAASIRVSILWLPRPPEKSRGSRDDGHDHKPAFTARPTIDVTPEMRGRINIKALERGLIVAETPHDLRAREVPQTQGDGTDGRSHRG